MSMTRSLSRAPSGARPAGRGRPPCSAARGVLLAALLGAFAWALILALALVVRG